MSSTPLTGSSLLSSLYIQMILIIVILDIVEKFEDFTRDETQASLEKSLTTLKGSLRSLASTSQDDSVALKQLASLVWNKCLEWKAKGQVGGEMNVRWRHFACDCLSLAAAEDPSDLKVQQDLLNMYLRTGKLWSGSIRSLAHLSLNFTFQS